MPAMIGSGVFSNIASFSFTDGPDTWTPANSTFGGTFLVNPDGSFLSWGFQIDVDGTRVAYSQTQYSAFYYQDHTPVGDSWIANQFSFDRPKGSWTVSTPEPSSLLLMGFGLAGFLTRKRFANLSTSGELIQTEPLLRGIK